MHDRSVLAAWCFMMDRALFELVVLYVAAQCSDEWDACWRLYELYAQQLTSEWSVPDASVSGRSRKKAESKEEHDIRLEGYAEMERKKRERYEAPLMYDIDEDEDEKGREAAVDGSWLSTGGVRGHGEGQGESSARGCQQFLVGE